MKTIVFACSLAALVAAGAVGASGNVSTPIGKLDRALGQLVSMRGGPPLSLIPHLTLPTKLEV
jgi:hypothetical protein